MKIFKRFDEFVSESSGEVFSPKRGKAVEFNHTDHPELAGEFFNLISIAYQEIGGHSKIKKPEDIFSDPDWNFWEGLDIHGTADFDIIMFGQKTKYGLKFSGVGHDGSKEAKKAYLEDRADDLVKPGYYIEVSGKIAEILLNKYKVPYVSDKETVEKVLGKKIEWLGVNSVSKDATGNGWYTRMLGGHPHTKILLGKPKV